VVDWDKETCESGDWVGEIDQKDLMFYATPYLSQDFWIEFSFSPCVDSGLPDGVECADENDFINYFKPESKNVDGAETDSFLTNTKVI